MTAFTSSQAGNWSSAATWGGAGVPGAGDTAWVKHAVTVDVATIVGLAAAVNQAGTGTIAISGTTVTGSGTAFTTQLKVGDVITAGGVSRTIIAITSNTAATTNQNGTVAAGTAFTFRPRSIYVDGGAAGTLTVAAGIRLTVRGDVMCRATTLQLNAGASLRFDSSTATGNPGYYLYLGCGESNADGATLKAVGTSGSRCAIDSNGSTPARILHVYANAGGSVDLAYTDLTDLGTSALDAIAIWPGQSGQKWKFDHCTYTRVGRLWTTNWDNVPGANDVSFTFCEVVSAPAGVSATAWDFLTINLYAKSTGLRQITDCSFALPDQDVHVTIGTNYNQFSFSRTVIGRLDTSGGGAGCNFATFDHNLVYVRKLGSSSQWSFVGGSGDTLSDCYVVNDEGPNQLNEHQLMANDNAAGGGIWKTLREVFERVGVNAAGTGQDVWHAPNPTTAMTVVADSVLVLPMSNGRSSGHIRARGNANTKYQVKNCTLMIDPVQSGGAGTEDGGCLAGSEYAGFAGMWDLLQNNLAWCKSLPISFLGYLLTYLGTGAPADLVNTAQVGGNAFYNANTGTQYDQNGLNGTSILGYHQLKQTTKITGATDVNLGTGSSESTSGPKFVDPTRNFATFDSAYLGNAATKGAWADATVYAVGDTVTASDAAFYNGATITYRCIKAHTSAAADSTNGKPGGATAQTGYRTNWEFASAYTIRKAIVGGLTITDAALGLSGADYITALHTWVRAGFAPTNTALKGTGIGGVDIGAVAVQLSAIAGTVAARLSPARLAALGQLAVAGAVATRAVPRARAAGAVAIAGRAAVRLAPARLGTAAASGVSQLPVAARQLPDWLAYAALNVPGLARGAVFVDPVTGQRTTKLASTTAPAANATGYDHPYSSGGYLVSKPWGSPASAYTLYLLADGSGAGYLQDYQLGVGLSGAARAAPWGSDLRYTFSPIVGEETIAYYFDGAAKLHRYDTAAAVMAEAPTALFPSGGKDFSARAGGAQQHQYLQVDVTGRYFVWMNQAGDTVFWWDAQTDTLRSLSETDLGAAIDEPHMDRDGRYVYVKMSLYVSGLNQHLWDTATDTFSARFAGLSHNDGLRNRCVGLDPNDGAHKVYTPAPLAGGRGASPVAAVGTLTTIGTDSQITADDGHRAGQWDQGDVGALQYTLLSTDAPGSVPTLAAWVLDAGSVYKTTVTYRWEQALTKVGVVWQLNTAGTAITSKLTQAASRAAMVAGSWFLDVDGVTLYVWRSDSAAPDGTTHQVLVQVPAMVHEALAYLRLDRGDLRILGHHYSFNPPTDYFSSPRATVSPDGRFAVFTSNMGVSGGPKAPFVVEAPAATTGPGGTIAIAGTARVRTGPRMAAAGTLTLAAFAGTLVAAMTGVRAAATGALRVAGTMLDRLRPGRVAARGFTATVPTPPVLPSTVDFDLAATSADLEE